MTIASFDEVNGKTPEEECSGCVTVPSERLRAQPAILHYKARNFPYPRMTRHGSLFHYLTLKCLAACQKGFARLPLTLVSISGFRLSRSGRAHTREAPAPSRSRTLGSQGRSCVARSHCKGRQRRVLLVVHRIFTVQHGRKTHQNFGRARRTLIGIVSD